MTNAPDYTLTSTGKWKKALGTLKKLFTLKKRFKRIFSGTMTEVIVYDEL